MSYFGHQMSRMFNESFIPGERELAQKYSDRYIAGLEVGTRLVKAAGLNSRKDVPRDDRAYFMLDVARQHGVDINAHGAIGVDEMHAFEYGRAAGMDHPLSLVLEEEN